MYRQTHGCHLICVSMHQLHTCEFKIMCSYSRPHCRTLTLAIFWADGPVAAPFLQVGVGALGVRVSLCLKTVIRVVSAVLHCFGVLQAVRRRHFQVVTASLVRGFAVARQGLQSLKSVALVFQHLASFVDHYLSECKSRWSCSWYFLHWTMVCKQSPRPSPETNRIQLKLA